MPSPTTAAVRASRAGHPADVPHHDSSTRGRAAIRRTRATLLGGVAWCACVLAPGCAPAASDAPGEPRSSEQSTHQVSSPSEVVDQALPLFLVPPDPSTWSSTSPGVQQAREALLAKDEARMKQILDQELVAHPENHEALLMRSMLHYQRAEVAAARPMLEQVLAGGPSFHGAEVAFYYYGASLLRLGDGVGARRALEAHVQVAPGDAETLSMLGDLDLQEGDADGALRHYELAMTTARDPACRDQDPAMSLARAQAGAARVRFSMEDVEGARELLAESLEGDPDRAQSHYLLSRILLRQGDKVGARHAMVDFKRLESGLPVRYYGKDDE